MKKGILVDDRIAFRSLFSLNLNLYVAVEVTSVPDHREAIQLLKESKDYDILVVRNAIARDDTSNIIAQYIDKYELNIPMVVLGKNLTLDRTIIQVDEVPTVKDVVKNVAKLTGVTARQMAEYQVPEYYPIDIEYFDFIENFPCKIFNRIRNPQDVKSFVHEELFDDGAKIDKSKFDNLKKDGITRFYVESTKRLNFVNGMNSQVVHKLNDLNISAEEKMDLTNEAMDIVGHRVKEMGLTKDVIQISEASISALNDIAKKKFKKAKGKDSRNKLKNLLSELLSADVSFRYKHCQLITYLIHHVIDNLEWGNNEHKEKLVYVAFFHDIILTTDEQAQIQSDEEMIELGLTSEEQIVVKMHALTASTLVREFPKLPLGVDAIIKQHHGSKTGVGLSRIDRPLSPLAAAFMVVEELACYIIMQEENGLTLQSEKIIPFIQAKFSDRQFKASVAAIEKLKF